MDKLDRNYTEYQGIYETDKALIEAFLTEFFPLWKEDILKFDELSKELNSDNIKQIDFWSYLGIDNELDYSLTMKDGTIKKYYVPKELLEDWLIQKDLIK